MEVIKLVPRGFCEGVVQAWATALKIAKKYPDRNIFMLGWLVHNQHLIDEMYDHNIKLLDDTNKSRYQLIADLDINLEPIIILSAHGTAGDVYQLIAKRGFLMFDTTCRYVIATHEIIKQKLLEGYQIIYLGKNNHPETIAALAIDSKIKLVATCDDVAQLTLDDNKLFVTNQTTISFYDFQAIVQALRLRFKNIEFRNDICNATKVRQEAVMKMDRSIDLCIVVGDQKSNNSKKLVEVAQKQGFKAHLVSDVNQLNVKWLTGVNKVAVTSGASTPTKITRAVVEFLERY